MIAPLLAANWDIFGRAESAAKTTRSILTDTFVVFLVGAVLFAALYVWARYFRKSRKRVAGGEKVYRSDSDADDSEAGDVRRRYKRRVRRRDHRVRNPTLAETGGLPPTRTEQPSGPS